MEIGFKYFFNFTTDIVILCDLFGHIIEYNDSAIDSLGYSNAEFSSLSILNIEASLNEAEFYRRVNIIITNKKYSFESEYTCKNGTIIPVMMNAGIINIGKKQEILCVAKNLSIGKSELAEFEGFEKMFNEIQKLGQIGYWELNLDTNEMYWSNEMYQILELDSNDYPPSYLTLLSVIHPDDLDKVNDLYSNALQNRIAYDFEYRLRLKNGTIKTVNEKCRFTPLSEKDLLVGIIQLVKTKTNKENKEENGTIKTISEKNLQSNNLFTSELDKIIDKDKSLKQQNLEYADLNKELIEIQRELQKIITLNAAYLKNKSHEIRTVLSSILGFSKQITKEGQTDENLQHLSENINANSDKLLSIIDDVIEISQVQAKQAQINNSLFDLLPLIQSLFNENKQRISPKIKFQFDFDTSIKKYFIQSDSSKIKQILKHLISNAIKFTKEGEIQLILKVSKAFVIFIVHDTGIGIPPGIKQDIFNPNSSLDKKNAFEQNGSGLGLPLVKSYIDMLNGQIEIKSEINIGTTVIVQIPLFQKSAEEFNDKKERTKDKNEYTILIVEDDYSNYLYLSELLDQSNMKILHVTDGSQAVELCKKEHEIDLVLMDIKMPVMDGIEATKLIKEFRNQLPIIAQTAYALDGDKNYFKKVGFDGYVTKPIDETLLFETIWKYI